MPDFDKLSSEWRPASGAAGKHEHAGASGKPEFGGGPNGGMSGGGAPHGGKGGEHASAGRGGTGGSNNPGGEAGSENAGNGGENEGATGGTNSTGGKGGTNSTGGKGGTNSTGGTTSAGGTISAGGMTSTGGTAGMTASGGMAGVMCEPGYATCSGSGDCATHLATGNPSGSTVNDCGTCGVTCSLTNASAATCTSGTCNPTCTGTSADCNASTANDGCESDLTMPTSCGSCDHPCSTNGATARSCMSGGLCVPTCSPKYLDCTADDGTHTDDGCETYVDALAACGATCSTPGTTCNPNQVCNGGACATASGLVAMSIPFTASGQGQRYADVFPALPNLTGSTVTLRMYAPNATSGSLSAHISDVPGNSGPNTSVPFTTLSAGWTDVVVQVGQPNGSYDPSRPHQVTIEFYASGTGPWANPTVVYLDGVWSGNLVVNDTFDSTQGNMVASTLLTVSGSSFGWVAATP